VERTVSPVVMVQSEGSSKAADELGMQGVAGFVGFDTRQQRQSANASHHQIQRLVPPNSSGSATAHS